MTREEQFRAKADASFERIRPSVTQRALSTSLSFSSIPYTLYNQMATTPGPYCLRQVASSATINPRTLNGAPASPPLAHKSTPSSSRKSSTSSTYSTSTTYSSSNDNTMSSVASSFDDAALASVESKLRIMEMAEGEDPQLAAARRALWEDSPEPSETSRTTSVFADDQEDSSEEGRPASASAGDDEESDDLDCLEYEVLSVHGLEKIVTEHVEGAEDDYRLPSPGRPSHATLPPLPSCLRPAPPQRSSSNHSSSGQSSVQFSLEPPLAFPAYSALDYERRGEGPIERLSIREWVELQGVREAFGVWSGKLDKWDDSMLLNEPCGAGGAGAPGSVSAPGSRRVSPASSCRNLREASFCGSLTTITGIVTVGSRHSSPMSSTVNLHGDD